MLDEVSLEHVSQVEDLLRKQNLLQGEGFTKIREESLASIKIGHGKVVHMYYAAVKGILDEKSFFTLLASLGIEAVQFFLWKDHYCDVNGPFLCAFQAGSYCDTKACNLPIE